MRALIRKWGNSASIRIPAWLMEAACLNLDETVDIREESGRIVIEPIHPKKYELGRLLAEITTENKHAEVDFGTPVGQELL